MVSLSPLWGLRDAASQPALELGNRTLMMDAGRVVFDVKGEERSRMTVDDLLEKFRENAGKALDNDRILLSKVEADN